MEESTPSAAWYRRSKSSTNSRAMTRYGSSVMPTLRASSRTARARCVLPLSENCPSVEELAVVGATRLHNRKFPQRPVVIQKTEPVVSAQGVVRFRQIRSQLQGLVDRSLRCCEALR